jgi:hypothetical protein
MADLVFNIYTVTIFCSNCCADKIIWIACPSLNDYEECDVFTLRCSN